MRFLIFLWAFLLSACAEPQYVSEAVSPQSVDKAGSGVYNCEAQFKNFDGCVTWAWEKEPNSKEYGRMQVKIFRPNRLDGSSLLIEPDAELDLILWMPSMGHGSVPTRTEKVDIGSYRIHNLFFVMPGEWEMKFQLKREGKLVDEALVFILR